MGGRKNETLNPNNPYRVRKNYENSGITGASSSPSYRGQRPNDQASRRGQSSAAQSQRNMAIYAAATSTAAFPSAQSMFLQRGREMQEARRQAPPPVTHPPPSSGGWAWWLQKDDEEMNRLNHAAEHGLAADSRMQVDEPSDPASILLRILNTPLPPTLTSHRSLFEAPTVSTGQVVSDSSVQAPQPGSITSSHALIVPAQGDNRAASPATQGTKLQQQLAVAGLPDQQQNHQDLELLLIKYNAQALVTAIRRPQSEMADLLAELKAAAKFSRHLLAMETEKWNQLDSLVTQLEIIHTKSQGNDSIITLTDLGALHQRSEELANQAAMGCGASWTPRSPPPAIHETYLNSSARFTRLKLHLGNKMPTLRGHVHAALSDKVLVDAMKSQSPEIRAAVTIPDWLDALPEMVFTDLAICKSFLSLYIKTTNDQGATSPERACQLKALSTALWSVALSRQLATYIRSLKSRYLPTYVLYQGQEEHWKSLWEPVQRGLLDCFQITARARTVPH